MDNRSRENSHARFEAEHSRSRHDWPSTLERGTEGDLAIIQVDEMVSNGTFLIETSKFRRRTP